MAASIMANPEHLRSAAIVYRRRSEWCAELSDAIQSIPLPAMPTWVAAELQWRQSSAAYALRDIRNRLWDDSVGLEKTARLFEESQRASGTSKVLWNAMQWLDKRSLLAPLVIPTIAHSVVAAVGHLAGGTVIDRRDFRGLEGTGAVKGFGKHLGAALPDLKSMGAKAQEAAHVITSVLTTKPGGAPDSKGPQPGPAPSTGTSPVTTTSQKFRAASESVSKLNLSAASFEADAVRTGRRVPRAGEECLIYAQERILEIKRVSGGAWAPEFIRAKGTNSGAFHVVYQGEDANLDPETRRPRSALKPSVQNAFDMTDYKKAGIEEGDLLVFDSVTNHLAGFERNRTWGHIAVVETVLEDRILVSEANVPRGGARFHWYQRDEPDEFGAYLNQPGVYVLPTDS